MDICAKGHEEVCYENTRCPCCDLLIEIKSLEERLQDLEEE